MISARGLHRNSFSSLTFDSVTLSNSDQTEQADNNDVDAEGSPLTVNSRASSIEASSRPDSGVGITTHKSDSSSSPSSATVITLRNVDLAAKAIVTSGSVVTPTKSNRSIASSGFDSAQSDVVTDDSSPIRAMAVTDDSSPIRATAITLPHATQLKVGTKAAVTQPGDIDDTTGRRSR